MKPLKNQRRAHEAVLVKEVIAALGLKKAHLKNQACYIDATVGTGGHSLELLKAGAKVLAIDADKQMLEIARKRLEKACPAPEDKLREDFKLVHGNFRKIDKIGQREGFSKVDGIIFDLGISSLHFASSSRGFSFKERKAPLDMRIDRESQKVTASDLLNNLRIDQLQRLFEATMAKLEAQKLAGAIVSKREGFPISAVGDLLSITEDVLGTSRKGRKLKLHPATKAFLALRMAVNSELENLKEVLPKAFDLLKKGGRLVVIAFHSGEDAIVKNYYRRKAKEGRAKILTKKPIVPGEQEVSQNPKARSAKMRALERL